MVNSSNQKKPMQDVTVRWWMRKALLLALAGAGMGWMAPGLGLPRAGAAEEPKVLVDSTAVPRDVRAGASYAPVIKKVSASVVSVYSTKTVKVSPRMMPFFDDPMLRRFFGFGEEEEAPRGQRQYKEQGLGSGVVVSADGYILSNNHVVEGADEVKVRLADGSSEYDAKVVGTDPKTDIAVLKVAATNLSPITLSDSDQLQVGDVVLAIGNPFNVGQTVTLGIVSALGRSSLGITDYEDFIQTDASINPGNSGGALVDALGRLVGVNTAIFSRSGGSLGIGFAIPANLAHNVMDQIIKNGRVVRGYLGIYVQPITPDLAKAFKLGDSKGALVGGVEKTTPAARAGLEEGDVITDLNGKKITDSRQFRNLVAQSAPESKVTLKIIRDGKEKTITATLGELPTDKTAGLREGGPGGAKANPLEGVTLEDLSSRWRDQFEIPAEIRGALVLKADPDSAAYEAGLRAGDVLLEINRQKVRDANDAVEVARNARSDRMLMRVWSRGGTHYIVVDASKKSKSNE